MKSRSRRAAAVFSIALAAALAAWGCGETGDTDPTPVQTFKITPAAGAATRPPESTPVASPTGAATPGATGSSSTIVIEGVSSTFDVEEITAQAGTITLEFDNRDGGVIHNLHVFRGDDADGESVAESELEVGPVRQTLVFEAAPGNYYYQCDSHPTTMKGTLTVE
jgi:plastocyanin